MSNVPARIPYVLAVLALVLAILLAYATDATLQRLYFDAMLGPGEGPTAAAPIIFSVMSLPVLAVIYVALAWPLFKRFSPTVAASVTYLLVGFPIFFAPISDFIIPFPRVLRGTPLDVLRIDLVSFGLESRLAHLSAFLIIVGLTALCASARKLPHPRSSNTPGAA